MDEDEYYNHTNHSTKHWDTMEAEIVQETPERSRATNPIYHGEYTIEDYRKEKEAKESSVESLKFMAMFMQLPPEEEARLRAIDEAAKGRYGGRTSWTFGGIWQHPGYDVENITGLDYYLKYYEISDEKAIQKRLEEIEAIGEYYDGMESRYIAMKEAADRSPEYIEALDGWLTLMDMTRLGTEDGFNGTRELFAAVIRQTGEESPEEAIAIETERLRKECERLEPIVTKTYDELKQDPKASKAIELIESKIPRKAYDKFFGPYRRAYGEEGYEGAIARVYRKAMTTRRIFLGTRPLNNEGNRWEGFGLVALIEILEQNGENVSETMGEMAELGLARKEDELESLEEIGMRSTLEMAKLNPFQEPKYDIITRDKYTRSYGTRKVRERCLSGNGTVKGRSVYRNQKTVDGEIIKGISTTIVVKNLNGGELSAEDMSLLSDIAALQLAHEKEAVRKGEPVTPLKISEGKLLSYRYGVRKMEATRAQKEEQFNRIVSLAGRVVEIDISNMLEEYDDLRARMDSMFPPGQVHDGVIGGNEIVIKYERSRNPRPSKILNEDGTETEEYEKTIWYIFKSYPLSILYSRLVNQVSLVDPSLKKTPTLYEHAGRNGGVLGGEAIKVLKRLEGNGTDLWKGKEKDGKKANRYISLNKSREFPTLKWAVLSEIEAKTADRNSKIVRAGRFTMDVDEILEKVWPDAPSSSRTGHVHNLLTYLVYLINNPDYKVQDIIPVRKGKKQADHVIIVLRKDKL